MSVTLIDIRHCDQSAELNARKVMAHLWPVYLKSWDQVKSPYDFTHEDLDSFFCDLTILARYFSDPKNLLNHEPQWESKPIYWSVNQGYTELLGYADSYYKEQYKIVLRSGTEIEITKIPAKELADV